MVKESDLNIGNSIYEGFNDKDGLMICGYEWGREAGDVEIKIDISKKCTFSNKTMRFGDIANSWVKYDGRIRNWFEIWGHPLNRNGDGDAFDKAIIQTNWALGAKGKSENIGFYLQKDNVSNFLYHVDELRPKVIFFMGNQLLTKLLRSPIVRDDFKKTMGQEISKLQVLRMPGYTGPLAYISSYQNCVVVGLPHPSGSHGLKEDYISYIKEYISPILDSFKEANTSRWSGDKA